MGAKPLRESVSSPASEVLRSGGVISQRFYADRRDPGCRNRGIPSHGFGDSYSAASGEIRTAVDRKLSFDFTNSSYGLHINYCYAGYGN